jgi:hypothetical protein
MTHDELLTKINSGMVTQEREYFALLSVVRLHKPRPSQFDDLECSQCTGDEDINQSFFYPCATIKAIEKELNG